MKRKITKLCTILLSVCLLSGCIGKNSDEVANKAETPQDYVDTYYHADDGVDYEQPIGYFYKDGETPYRIVIPANASETETYAANELSLLFHQLTGVKIKTVKDSEETFDTNNNVISIGKTIYQKTVDLSDVNYDELKTDGFITKTFGNVYVLDSGSKDGLIYSVYNLLEIFFDLEFMTFEYTYMPETPKEVVAYKTDIVDIPNFAVRDYYAFSAFEHSAEYGARMRCNSSTYTQNSVLDKNYYFGYYMEYNGDDSWFPPRMGHTTQGLLAADAYRNNINRSIVSKENDSPRFMTEINGSSKWYPLGYYNVHPEWYAQDTAFRNNPNGDSQEELCYTNGITDDGEFDSAWKDSLARKMVEICQYMILDERNSESTCIMLGHQDWETMCMCKRCQASYEKYGAYSGTYIVWANAVVREVKAWMAAEGIKRDIKFSILAYMKSINPPGTFYDEQQKFIPVSDKVILDDSIAVQIAWSGCRLHGLWDENCDQNAVKRKEFISWTTLAKSLEIWDYDCVFTDYLWYMPTAQLHSDEYKYYASVGVERLLTQGSPTEGRYYQHHMKHWLSLKLMWNQNRDVNELIEEFNKKYFSEKYATYVNQYLDIMNNHLAVLDHAKKEGIHLAMNGSLDTTSPEVYDYELLKKVIELLYDGIEEAEKDESLSKEERELIVKHLREVVVTPEYMVLRLQYIVEPSELEEFATKFFYNVDLLGLVNYKEGTGNLFSTWKQSFGL